MRDDDRDDPFDEFINEIERMMNEMMGSDTNVHFEQPNTSSTVETGPDVHMDIHEGNEEVRVVADIPGVNKDDIELKCDGRTLHLTAASDSREYREQVSLPTAVDEHSAQATYNNGVLEVVFDRDSESTSIDI
jgi:HSP20 family protein